MKNILFFGDNLHVLRESVASESVDLVYLDPPFNSARDYNLLFKAPKNVGKKSKAAKAQTPEAADAKPEEEVYSEAQITAFEDTWHWGLQAEREYAEITRGKNTQVSEMIQALRRFLSDNDMLAYLVMMCNRLLELHRVLKPTGSLYLHCDPTASHYLKIVLDGVFGKENYRNEISWKRANAHNDAKKKFANLTDIIFFYVKSEAAPFFPQFTHYDDEYLKKFYRHDDNDGKGLYQLDNMASPNPRPNMMYEWKGFVAPPKGWRYELKTMQRLDEEARIWYPLCKDGTPDYTKRPRLKRYLLEQQGNIVSNRWDDIQSLQATSAEFLGYPTQKPLALLERIIEASSNEGDVVLDPFCGCGTAVHAAQKLGRNWIGIDITHLAISLIEKRLRDAFPAIEFEVEGTPQDLNAAKDLAKRDKYQFQWWACSLVNAQPYQGKKKGADGGIDGLVYFQHTDKELGKVVVSVKGGENINVAMVRDLGHVIEREGAHMGVFITLTAPTKPMLAEAAGLGFYTNPLNQKDYPKLQILEIEALLNQTQRLETPEFGAGDMSFKRAAREEKPINQSGLF